MSLCDDCIKVLTNNLSSEAIEILNKVDLFNELSERELARKLTLNHNHVKKLLYELEAKLLVNYKSYGRTKAYHLTKNGSRLLNLEEEEVVKDSEFAKNQENNDFSQDEKASKEEIEENAENELNKQEENDINKENKQEVEREKEEDEIKSKEKEEKKESDLVWDFK